MISHPNANAPAIKAEWLSPKLSEETGDVILTDVENGGLALLDQRGTLKTLVTMEDVDWADGVAVAPNRDIWFTDSRLTALLDQFGRPASIAVMEAAAPFHIYRIPTVDF